MPRKTGKKNDPTAMPDLRGHYHRVGLVGNLAGVSMLWTSLGKHPARLAIGKALAAEEIYTSGCWSSGTYTITLLHQREWWHQERRGGTLPKDIAGHDSSPHDSQQDAAFRGCSAGPVDNDNENMFITINLHMYKIQDARYKYPENKHETEAYGPQFLLYNRKHFILRVQKTGNDADW